MLSFGMSANFLQLSGRFDFPTASFRTPLKKYCQALFLICKGSTWARSINFPIKGANSWRLYLRAINSVTLLRNCFALSCFSDKDFLNLSTSFAILILSSYFQGFHMVCVLGGRIVLLCDKLRWDKNVPFKSVQLAFETSAKVEKNLALLGSSPPSITTSSCHLAIGHI